MYVPVSGKDSQGNACFSSPNPPFGATFTYYLKETIKTKKDIRKDAEAEAIKKKEEIKYPTTDELRLEDDEIAPYLVFTITDESGNIVRRLKAAATAGISRITWDLRYATTNPAWGEGDPFSNNDGLLMAMPGKYKVSIGKVVNGVFTDLGQSREFNTVLLNNTSLPDADPQGSLAFQKKVAELLRAVQGSINLSNDLTYRLSSIKQALKNTLYGTDDLMALTIDLERRNTAIKRQLTGDETLAKRNENQPPSISDRVNNVIWGYWRSTSEPTQTMRQDYEIAGNAYTKILADQKTMIEKDLPSIEAKMEQLKSPWTPWRVPEWQK